MRYKIYVNEVIQTDSNLCVVKTKLNGKDTQICLPKDCGIDKYLGEEVYCEIKDKKVRISKAHQPHVRGRDHLLKLMRKGRNNLSFFLFYIENGGWFYKNPGY